MDKKIKQNRSNANKSRLVHKKESEHFVNNADIRDSKSPISPVRNVASPDPYYTQQHHGKPSVSALESESLEVLEQSSGWLDIKQKTKKEDDDRSSLPVSVS